EVTCRKKRRCSSRNSGSSDATIVALTEPTVGLVVLFTPLNPDVSIDFIDSVRVSNTLETLVPSCVIEARFNRRKNLLAVDTRNGQTTRVLLGLTTLCGMKVQAFEPLDLYVNNPLQCHRCGLFGHVAASCKRKLACLRSAQPHATAQCDASDLHCVNCNKSHEATSHICPFWQAELTVCRYHCENNVPFAQARAAFDKPNDAQAVPEAQAAPEVVISSPEHPQRRRHSRRHQDIKCSQHRSRYHVGPRVLRQQKRETKLQRCTVQQP
ncbi:hypothetical protein HPB47_015867, partial [Ixodes persulcatus]